MKRVYKRVSENVFCNLLDKFARDKSLGKLTIKGDTAYLNSRKIAYFKPFFGSDFFGDHYVLEDLL